MLPIGGRELLSLLSDLTLKATYMWKSVQEAGSVLKQGLENIENLGGCLASSER